MKLLTKEEVIKKFIEQHGYKYDYSKVIYINARTKVCIICPNHGEFWQTPGNHLKGMNCYHCSLNDRINLIKFTLEEFIEKAIAIHGNKYDYSKVIYLNNYTKVKIICPIHGEFLQTPSNHLSGQGCIKCRNDKIGNLFRSNREEFIDKANKIHNSIFNYNNVFYIDAYKKVSIICYKHGIFEQTPAAHLQGQGCPYCKASKGELAIKAILDKHNITVEPQYRLPDEKYPYKYDFYLPEYNILIEFHGIQHYEWIPYFHKNQEDFEDQRRRDKCKLWLAKEKNIPLIEFNYKQLKELSRYKFEKILLAYINNRRKLNERL